MKKDAFIRIPKTGSTSLKSSIQNSNTITFVGYSGHSYCYNIEGYPYFNPLDYNKLYILIRNPFDVLISYYYHTHKNSKKIEGWNYCNLKHNFKSWEEFLESYINPNFKWHIPQMKKSLFSMAYDKDWNLIIDRYFKIENPNNINNFLQYNNLPILNKLNITKNKLRKKHYTPEQVEKLNKIWERDLNHFNYKYENL
jgi:hypothetical protein